MYIKQGILIACIGLCLTGCDQPKEDVKSTAEPLTESEAAVQTADTGKQTEDKNFFPESYSYQTEKIKFECQLEIPENFNPSDFHAPVIKGASQVDPEAIYAKYVDGNVVTEEHHDPPVGENERGNDAYILEDGTLVGITEGFVYQKLEASDYRRVVRDNERSAPKEDFSFATGESCVEQVKEELELIGCPADEYQFGWFSTSGEEYAILEQRALEDGMINSQSLKSNGWTEEDNAYEIYGWQTYEGLPVFPWVMTSTMLRSVENYQKAPVSALYTKQGMLGFLLTEPPYVFESSEEILEFRTFPEIAEVLIQKYEDLLDEAVYTVNRAKLAVRTYYDESQQLAAEPIWYFEVTDGSSLEIVLVNAVTAEEIFLQ